LVALLVCFSSVYGLTVVQALEMSATLIAAATAFMHRFMVDLRRIQ